MISKNALKEQEMIFGSVYRLLDKYHLYGHLYNELGDVDMRYRLQYYDDNGFICDCELRPLDFNPGDEDEYCEEYCAILDVHRSTVFRNMFSFEELEALSCEVILEKYLSGYIDKLLAMLRRGRNYASDSPIPRYHSDDYLKMIVATVWKMFVIRTLDNYAVKRKFANQPADPENPTSFEWDRRHYAHEISADEDIVEVPLNISELFSEQAQARRREQEARRLARQQEVSQVISDSLSDEDREFYADFFRKLSEATSDW